MVPVVVETYWGGGGVCFKSVNQFSRCQSLKVVSVVLSGCINREIQPSLHNLGYQFNSIRFFRNSFKLLRQCNDSLMMRPRTGWPKSLRPGL